MRDLHPCLVLSDSARLCCWLDSLAESPQYRPEHTPPRGTSEGQAKVARRPENEVRTTSPAITQQFPQLVVRKLKYQKCNSNSWIVSTCWCGWEVGREDTNAGPPKSNQTLEKEWMCTVCMQMRDKRDGLIPCAPTDTVLLLGELKGLGKLKASTLLIVLLNFASRCCWHPGEIRLFTDHFPVYLNSLNTQNTKPTGFLASSSVLFLTVNLCNNSKEYFQSLSVVKTTGRDQPV